VYSICYENATRKFSRGISVFRAGFFRSSSRAKLKTVVDNNFTQLKRSSLPPQLKETSTISNQCKYPTVRLAEGLDPHNDNSAGVSRDIVPVPAQTTSGVRVRGCRRSPSGGDVGGGNTRPSVVVPATSRRRHDPVRAATVSQQRRHDPLLRQRAQTVSRPAITSSP